MDAQLEDARRRWDDVLPFMIIMLIAAGVLAERLGEGVLVTVLALGACCIAFMTLPVWVARRWWDNILLACAVFLVAIGLFTQPLVSFDAALTPAFLGLLLAIAAVPYWCVRKVREHSQALRLRREEWARLPENLRALHYRGRALTLAGAILVIAGIALWTWMEELGGGGAVRATLSRVIDLSYLPLIIGIPGFLLCAVGFGMASPPRAQKLSGLRRMQLLAMLALAGMALAILLLLSRGAVLTMPTLEAALVWSLVMLSLQLGLITLFFSLLAEFFRPVFSAADYPALPTEPQISPLHAGSSVILSLVVLWVYSAFPGNSAFTMLLILLGVATSFFFLLTFVIRPYRK